MKKSLIIFCLIITVFLVFAPVSANAQLDLAKSKLEGLGASKFGMAPDIQTSLGNIVRGVLALAGTIFLILTVYGGITWMTAMGDESKVEKAKNIVTAAVIGMAITFSAYAITVFVMSKVGSGVNVSPIEEDGDEEEGGKCGDLGGWCTGPKDTLIVANSFDPDQPCDPDYTGDLDPFTNQQLGAEGKLGCAAGQYCCELTERAGEGVKKCEVRGGTCFNAGSACPSGYETLGQCDKPYSNTDGPCCKQN